MKKIIWLGLWCLGSFLFCFRCYAETVGSLELLNHAKEYDKKEVVYQGEVIGDIMRRGDHAWVHVNDGTIAIGIWVSEAMAQDVRHIGDHKTKGDLAEVRGVFHRACVEHGGDLDIHASEIKTLVPGGPVILSISRKKITVALSSLIFVLLLFLIMRHQLGNDF